MDDDERHIPMAGTDWRVERRQDGSVLYVTEENDEDVVVIPREHAEAIAVAVGASF